MILQQIEARADRWPDAPLRVLVPRAWQTVTCQGDPDLYREEPTSAAITHLSEAWAVLLMARAAREHARATATARRASGPRPGDAA